MTIYPQLKVEIAFQNDPYATSPTWTDVTRYVRGDVSVRRGRGTFELNKTEAGTLGLQLENTDGRFSPLNTASPYAPYVLPSRPIRVTASDSNGTVYPVFRGFVERWPQQWSEAGNYGTVAITAVDGLKAVLKKKLTARYQETVVADAAFDFWRASGTASVGSNSSANYQLSGASTPSSPGAVAGSPLYGARVSATTGPFPALTASAPANYYQQYGFSAATFVGATSQIATFQALNDCAYELWFRPQSVPADGSFVDLIIDYSETWTSPSSAAILQGYLRLTFGAGGATYSVASTRATGTGTVSSPLTLTGTSAPLVGKWDHWVVSRTGSTVTVYQNAVAVGTFTVAAGSYVWQSNQPGGSGTTFEALWYGATQNKVSPYFHDVAEVALYKNALTASQITNHYLTAQSYHELDTGTAGAQISNLLDGINWPSVLRGTIDLTGSTLQPTGSLSGTTALDVANAAADAELGVLYLDAQGRFVFRNRAARNNVASVATFGEGSGETPYLEGVTVDFDDTYVYNDISVTQSSSSPTYTRTATDAASMVTYGDAVLPRTVALSTASDVQAQADTLLARYKQPVARLSQLPVDIRSNPAAIAAVLAREIGDLVTVKRRPLGAPAISLDVFVDGVEDRISTSSWTRTFLLTPKFANSTY